MILKGWLDMLMAVRFAVCDSRMSAVIKWAINQSSMGYLEICVHERKNTKDRPNTTFSLSGGPVPYKIGVSLSPRRPASNVVPSFRVTIFKIDQNVASSENHHLSNELGLIKKK